MIEEKVIRHGDHESKPEEFYQVASGWDSIAGHYDHARPFPSRQVKALFAESSLCADMLGREGASVCEPGVGTGRILLPIAEAYPHCTFAGFDRGGNMLAVAERKARSMGASTYLYEGSVETWDDISRFDVIILSSVLHAIEGWKGVAGRLANNMKGGSLLCLVGDGGDVYDQALGRGDHTHVDPKLAHFWAVYRALRHEVDAPNPERSQVGCQWDVENTELVQHLKTLGLKHCERCEVKWKQEFSIGDLLEIVSNRAYSSIFTLDAMQLEQIISGLEKAFSKERGEVVPSQHSGVLQVLQKV